MSQMDEVKTDLTVRIIEVLESIATSLARIEEQNSTYYKEYLHEFKENNKKTMESDSLDSSLPDMDYSRCTMGFHEHRCNDRREDNNSR